MRWSALAGLSAAALVALGGGSVAAPAAAVRAAADASSKFTWHAFKMLNGWESASMPKLKTGTPSWALRGGVVYLRGAVKVATDKGDAVFSTLPKYARPARNLYIQVFTTSETPGTVRIGDDGSVEAYNGNAKLFTSLAGISYPIAPIKSHQLTLGHGWISASRNMAPVIRRTRSVEGSCTCPAYAIINGVVYFTGTMLGPSAADGLWTDYPKGVKTAADVLELEVYTSGPHGAIAVTNSLGLVASSPFSFAQGCTSLGGIAYPQSS